MLVTDFVAKKFKVLQSLEKMSIGMKIEDKVKKDVDIEKQVLNQLLIMAATIIRSQNKNLPEDIGAEIFDMYDVKIVVEKKKQSDVLVLGGVV